MSISCQFYKTLSNNSTTKFCDPAPERKLTMQLLTFVSMSLLDDFSCDIFICSNSCHYQVKKSNVNFLFAKRKCNLQDVKLAIGINNNK